MKGFKPGREKCSDLCLIKNITAAGCRTGWRRADARETSQKIAEAIQMEQWPWRVGRGEAEEDICFLAQISPHSGNNPWSIRAEVSIRGPNTEDRSREHSGSS